MSILITHCPEKVLAFAKRSWANKIADEGGGSAETWAWKLKTNQVMRQLGRTISKAVWCFTELVT